MIKLILSILILIVAVKAQSPPQIPIGYFSRFSGWQCSAPINTYIYTDDNGYQIFNVDLNRMNIGNVTMGTGNSFSGMGYLYSNNVFSELTPVTGNLTSMFYFDATYAPTSNFPGAIDTYVMQSCSSKQIEFSHK